MGVRFKDLDLSFGTVKIPASQKDLTVPAYKSLMEARSAYSEEHDELPLFDWACTILAAYNDVEECEVTVDDCFGVIGSILSAEADQGK